MKSENGDIQIYFDLFRHYRILDDDDKKLMKHLLKNRKLCPICFRPYSGNNDRYYQWQVILEIISYYIFIILIWLPLLILLSFPSLISWIINKFKFNQFNVYNLLNENNYDNLVKIFDKSQQETQLKTRTVINNTQYHQYNEESLLNLDDNNKMENDDDILSCINKIKELHENTLKKLIAMEDKIVTINDKQECSLNSKKEEKRDKCLNRNSVDSDLQQQTTDIESEFEDTMDEIDIDSIKICCQY